MPLKTLKKAVASDCRRHLKDVMKPNISLYLSSKHYCTYVVERDDAVLWNERAHLKLVARVLGAEGVRWEREVV